MTGPDRRLTVLARNLQQACARPDIELYARAELQVRARTALLRRSLALVQAAGERERLHLTRPRTFAGVWTVRTPDDANGEIKFRDCEDWCDHFAFLAERSLYTRPVLAILFDIGKERSDFIDHSRQCRWRKLVADPFQNDKP